MSIGAVQSLAEEAMEASLAMVQSLANQPVPSSDPSPGLVGEGLYVGNKFHAADVDLLVALGVTAVLNCAPGGIRSLPIEAYQAQGIEYGFTNVAQDAHDYPILHEPDGGRSEHLAKALAFYERTRRAGGTALFFCVAGQNRSATLAVAVQLLAGHSLRFVLTACSASRPFILENPGFQRQLVELEAAVHAAAVHAAAEGGDSKRPRLTERNEEEGSGEEESVVVVELLVPGLSKTFHVPLPCEASVDEARARIINVVDDHLSRGGTGASPRRIGRAWLLFTTYQQTEGCSLVLDDAAVERQVRLDHDPLAATRRRHPRAATRAPLTRAPPPARR